MLRAIFLGAAIAVPLFILAGLALFLVVFPEKAAKRRIIRLDAQNDPEETERICGRYKTLGIILFILTFILLLAAVVSAWLGWLA